MKNLIKIAGAIVLVLVAFWAVSFIFTGLIWAVKIALVVGIVAGGGYLVLKATKRLKN